MQLPDFIKRMLGFADKVEANLTAATELATANAKISTAEADLATAKQTIASIGAELEQERTAHSETKATLQKTLDEVNAKGAEIKTLQASVETEKGRANAVIASQGLQAEQLPTSTVTSTPQGNQTPPALDPKLKGNARLMAHFSSKK